MAEKELKWLHSGGVFNKNPNYDLGGDPSKFEIAVVPYNNLFDDITPEESWEGHTDYRCFYIVNKYQDSDYDITLNTDTAFISCTSVFVGSVVQNEEQKITFKGPAPSATSNNYFICQLDWGPQLTVKWNGSYANMAADMQAKIQLVKYCAGVTVSVLSIFPGDAGATLQVIFDGQLQHRKMGLIKIIKSLQQVDGGNREYRVDNAGATPSTFNYQFTPAVQVHQLISNVPSVGVIHIPYPYADVITPSPETFTYMHLSYSNFSGKLFNLIGVIPSIPVPYVDVSVTTIRNILGKNDEVWVDEKSDTIPPNQMGVTRIQEGSPINQLAQVIEKETDIPLSWSDQGTTFHVGLIRPLEGFFVWVKRASTVTYGCKDRLSISLNGQRVS